MSTWYLGWHRRWWAMSQETPSKGPWHGGDLPQNRLHVAALVIEIGSRAWSLLDSHGRVES